MIVRHILEEEQTCELCDRTIPKHGVALRKQETGKILCILCLVEIAELSKAETASGPRT